jgi:Uma2 family endonuclease
MAVPATKRWTLEEVHRLPDDGNKYELVHGELFVTPPPTNVHETIHARLMRLLVPYVDANRLGLVYAGTPAVRRGDNEALPDLIVRAEAPGVYNDWENAPTPILVVEILSDSTRRRDLGAKRRYYMNDVKVAEYWAVDPQQRTVTVARQGRPDRVVDQVLAWHPAGASTPLEMRLEDVFGAFTKPGSGE